MDGDSFPIAMRYTDNVSAPSFVQLGKLVIRPSGNSYCKIFYPLGSDVCTSAETISCEPDVEIEIDPPAEWGRYEIRCGNCHADLCA